MREVTKQTRELLSSIVGNNKQLIRWLESIQENTSELPGEIDDIIESITQIELQINSIESELDNLEDELTLLQDALDELSAEVALINGVTSGEVEIDFGVWPGSNEASILIPDMSANDDWNVRAYIMAGDSTADHTAVDHRYIGLFLTLTASVTAGVGITIYAMAPNPLVGTFNIRYERVN